VSATSKSPVLSPLSVNVIVAVGVELARSTVIVAVGVAETVTGMVAELPCGMVDVNGALVNTGAAGVSKLMTTTPAPDFTPAAGVPIGAMLVESKPEPPPPPPAAWPVGVPAAPPPPPPR
jgi:hypothetical protein